MDLLMYGYFVIFRRVERKVKIDEIRRKYGKLNN